MKQTSIKKMLALFLIAAVMLAAFTACAEKAPDTAQTQQPASDAAVPADDKAAETSIHARRTRYDQLLASLQRAVRRE